MNKVLNFLVGLLLISGLCLVSYVGYKRFNGQAKKSPLIKPSVETVNVMTDSAPMDPLDPFTIEAIKKIVRLDPDTIKGMPSFLRFTLKREKCDALEQNGKPVWIKGSFYKIGQTDYAALCITPDNEMTIKIYWGGIRPKCSISLAYGKAEKYVTLTPEGPLKFSRILGLANSKRLQYFAEQNKVKLPNAVLEGLEDIVMDRKSTIYFCNGSKWIPLPAAI